MRRKRRQKEKRRKRRRRRSDGTVSFYHSSGCGAVRNCETDI
jgi:hypothetical protein